MGYGFALLVKTNSDDKEQLRKLTSDKINKSRYRVTVDSLANHVPMNLLAYHYFLITNREMFYFVEVHTTGSWHSSQWHRDDLAVGPTEKAVFTSL